jgi:RimJ/RimL family protein N-acetyltransferase
VPELARCCDDDEIARWLDSVPHPYTEADAADYVGRARRWWRDGTFFPFAVTDGDGRLIGAVGCGWADRGALVAEIGYWTRREARGNGAAPAALRLAAGWAIEELGAERVQVRVEVENAASQRVAQKAGFTREGVLRSSGWSPRRGRRLDFVVFSLLPGEL